MDNIPTTDASDWIAPAQASRILGISAKSLRRLAAQGDISVRLLPSGHRRYSQSELTTLGVIRKAS